MQKEYWTTADNRRLDIDEITDLNHLHNIVKTMIRRERRFIQRDRSTVEKYNALVDKYNALLNGRSFVSLNGDIAQSYFNDCENRRIDPNPNLPW